MKALLNRSYGSPEVLELADIDTPAPAGGEVLVRVHAASLNPLDWHFLTGTPYPIRAMSGLRRPKQPIRGVDLAGVVEAVGAGVTAFAPGDAVFGFGIGSFAERAIAKERALSRLPDGSTFEHGAAIPIAGITALQGLDRAGVTTGTSVLVNGAAGGVGTFAVQLAAARGAEVTGVCSTRNVELVRSLGASRVIDYTSVDMMAEGRRYDVVFDNVGNRSLSECRRLLAPRGTYVLIGGRKKGRVLGPLKRLIATRVAFWHGSKRAITFNAVPSSDDLATIAALVASGAVRSVIGARCALADVPEALRELAAGHTKGKVVVEVVSSRTTGPDTAAE